RRMGRTGAPRRYALTRAEYLALTLHRPALADGPLPEDAFLHLEAIAAELVVVFPVHPRPRAALEAHGIRPRTAGLKLLEPLGYLEFLSLVAGAAGGPTDSRRVQ